MFPTNSDTGKSFCVKFAESSRAEEASIGLLQSPSSELCEAFASLKTGSILCVICVK